MLICILEQRQRFSPSTFSVRSPKTNHAAKCVCAGRGLFFWHFPAAAWLCAGAGLGAHPPQSRSAWVCTGAGWALAVRRRLAGAGATVDVPPQPRVGRVGVVRVPTPGPFLQTAWVALTPQEQRAMRGAEGDRRTQLPGEHALLRRCRCRWRPLPLRPRLRRGQATIALLASVRDAKPCLCVVHCLCI